MLGTMGRHIFVLRRKFFIYLPEVLCHSLCYISGTIAPIIIKPAKIMQTLNGCLTICNMSMNRSQTEEFYDPSEYVPLVYADRMRTAADKQKVLSIAEETFQSRPSEHCVDIRVMTDYVQIGHSWLARRGTAMNSDASRHNFSLQLLHHCVAPLESLMKCVQMNWMAILVSYSILPPHIQIIDRKLIHLLPSSSFFLLFLPSTVFTILLLSLCGRNTGIFSVGWISVNVFLPLLYTSHLLSSKLLYIYRYLCHGLLKFSIFHL